MLKTKLANWATPKLPTPSSCRRARRRPTPAACRPCSFLFGQLFVYSASFAAFAPTVPQRSSICRRVRGAQSAPKASKKRRPERDARARLHLPDGRSSRGAPIRAQAEAMPEEVEKSGRKKARLAPKTVCRGAAGSASTGSAPQAGSAELCGDVLEGLSSVLATQRAGRFFQVSASSRRLFGERKGLFRAIISRFVSTNLEIISREGSSRLLQAH